MIQVSKTFLKNGQIQTVTLEIKEHGSFSAFKKGAIATAKMLASSRNGSVQFAQDNKNLFVNYAEVPKTNKINTSYRLI